MEKRNKRRKALITAAILLVFAVIAANVAFKVYISNYYVADEKEIEEIATELKNNSVAYEVENGKVFLPVGQRPKAIIAFYPGGKVEAESYSGLMYKLASRGYLCILPNMPQNIALLGIDAVEGFKAENEEMQEVADHLDWYMAGHSLGGVAAVKYLKDILEGKGNMNIPGGVGKYKGLILCASFPSMDISDKDIRMLSIYGSNDGVLKMDSYEESRINWPKNSKEVVIDGGIHSYFGSYGIQEGDGTPLISNKEQLEKTADIIDQWIGEHQEELHGF